MPTKKAKNPTTTESSNDKFVRIANIRVDKALGVLATIENLGGKAYDRKVDQVAAIMAALDGAVESIRGALDVKNTGSTTKSKRFQL